MIYTLFISVASISIFYILQNLFYYLVYCVTPKRKVVSQEEKGTKKISFEVLKELHAEVKSRAAKAGIDMKTWLINAITREMAFEDSQEKV